MAWMSVRRTPVVRIVEWQGTHQGYFWTSGIEVGKPNADISSVDNDAQLRAINLVFLAVLFLLRTGF